MKIYLDTSAFFYFFFDNPNYSAAMKKEFEKIKRGDYKAMTSCFTLEELAYVVLVKLIEKKYNKHPAEILRQNRAVISEFTQEIRRMFAAIYSFENIEIAGSDKIQTWFMVDIMAENLLLPRDSIHLKTMRDFGIECILSTDADFDGINGIRRIR